MVANALDELRIESWRCDDCELTASDRWEKQVHEDLTDHTLVAEYV